MSQTFTPQWAIGFMPENPTNAHVILNESIERISALAWPSAIAIQNAPPGSPANGDTYVIGTAGTGAWLGHSNKLAVYVNGSWEFFSPNNTGLRVWVQAVKRYISWDPVTGSWKDEPHRRSVQRTTMALQDPSVAEYTALFVPNAMTISEVRAVVNGASGSGFSFNIRHSTDRSAAGNTVFTSTQAATSITTPHLFNSGFNDNTVPADSWVWLDVTAIDSTPSAPTEAVVLIDWSFDA